MNDNSQRWNVLFLSTLILLPLGVYWSLWDAAFINFDTPRYLVDNPIVTKGFSKDSLHYAFTSFTLSNWHPVTWLSHMADFSMFGNDTGAHHMANVFVHIMASLVLFFAMRRLTGQVGSAGVIALIFVLHPLQVESVAWACQRKATLSAFFGFLSLWAWLGYARDGQMRDYWASCAFFGLSLMSKSAFITLPFVFILLEMTVLQRHVGKGETLADLLRGLWPSLKEKIPLFLLLAGGAIMTVVAGSVRNALSINTTVPHLTRVLNALKAYCTYPLDYLWPQDLALFYPMNPNPPSLLISMVCIVVVVGLTLLAIVLRKRSPFFSVGWLWYVGVLFPMSGVVQTGFHARADRFAYLPMVGLTLIIVMVPNWTKIGRLAQLLGVLVVAALGFVTYQQVAHWHNGESIFRHSIEATGRDSRMTLLLVQELFRADKDDEAQTYLDRFIAQQRDIPEDHMTLGDILLSMGQKERARTHIERAVELAPENPNAWVGLGRLVGGDDEAKGLAHLEHALTLDPKHGPANYYLSIHYEGKGDKTQALKMLLRARAAGASFPDINYRLGVLYEGVGNILAAKESFERQLQRAPKHGASLFALASIAARGNGMDQALIYLERALTADPNFTRARTFLGYTLAKMDRHEEAITAFERSVAQDDRDVQAWLLLGTSREILGLNETATEAYQQVLAIDPDQRQAKEGVKRLQARIQETSNKSTSQ